MMTRRSLLTRSGLTFLGTASACFGLGGDNPAGGQGDEFLPDGSSARGMITDATDAAIDRGLRYLSQNQRREPGRTDGAFGNGRYESHVAITSLAGLAFMAAGHQPNRGIYGTCVTRALQYLLRLIPERLGFLNPIGGDRNGAMYGHGFGTLFLAEACGMVHDKQLRVTIRERLKQAVQLILNAQNHEGGWRYMPSPNDADLSVTVCQMMALHCTMPVSACRVPRSSIASNTLKNASKATARIAIN